MTAEPPRTLDRDRTAQENRKGIGTAGCGGPRSFRRTSARSAHEMGSRYGFKLQARNGNRATLASATKPRHSMIQAGSAPRTPPSASPSHGRGVRHTFRSVPEPPRSRLAFIHIPPSCSEKLQKMDSASGASQTKYTWRPPPCMILAARVKYDRTF